MDLTYVVISDVSASGLYGTTRNNVMQFSIFIKKVSKLVKKVRARSKMNPVGHNNKFTKIQELIYLKYNIGNRAIRI